MLGNTEDWPRPKKIVATLSSNQKNAYFSTAVKNNMIWMHLVMDSIMRFLSQ